MFVFRTGPLARSLCIPSPEICSLNAGLVVEGRGRVEGGLVGLVSGRVSADSMQSRELGRMLHNL